MKLQIGVSKFQFKVSFLSSELDRLVVWEPDSDSCLNLIFVPFPCDKVVIVPDTNHITPAIKKCHVGHAKSW